MPLTEDAGDAEVTQLWTSVGREKQVARRDVAVGKTAHMQMLQGGHDGDGHRHHLLRCERAARSH